MKKVVTAMASATFQVDDLTVLARTYSEQPFGSESKKYFLETKILEGGKVHTFVERIIHDDGLYMNTEEIIRENRFKHHDIAYDDTLKSELRSRNYAERAVKKFRNGEYLPLKVEEEIEEESVGYPTTEEILSGIKFTLNIRRDIPRIEGGKSTATLRLEYDLADPKSWHYAAIPVLVASDSSQRQYTRNGYLVVSDVFLDRPEELAVEQGPLGDQIRLLQHRLVSEVKKAVEEDRARKATIKEDLYGSSNTCSHCHHCRGR